MSKPIYLDYNATTPLDPSVFETMLPFFKEEFGNASSSSHSYGWKAEMAVQKARKQVADLIGSSPSEIIWTSGATESNNLAILGYLRNFTDEKPHVITTNIEHKAVLEVCCCSEKDGAEVTYLPVDEYGQVSASQVEQALKPNTKLVSVMMANNEIGTINPIAEIGALLKSKNIIFHTDAAQTLGKLPIDVQKMNVDMLSMSGHKIYGPKGVGALFVKKKDPSIRLVPIICGGDQEKGVRPGTLNVPGIVGLGAACKLAFEKMESETRRLTRLRDQIIEEIQKACPEAVLNGHPKERLYNNVSLSFKGLSSDVFALGLSGLALSSGSACTSASGRPSHVISALGRPPELARATIRIGLGSMTTESDVSTAVQKVIGMVEKNRVISKA